MSYDFKAIQLFDLAILKKALSLSEKFGRSAGPIIFAVDDWLAGERLRAIASKIPLLRKNFDYNEGWTGSIEEVKKRRLKRLKNTVEKHRTKAKKKASAYCAKEDVKEYWREAGDSEDEALQEFLRYIDEVKCN
jgi:hypothetical protein